MQETWLKDFEIQFLNSIDDNFYASGISAMDSGLEVHKGRPYGGLGILWKKSLGQVCSVIEFDDTRLCAIEMSLNNSKILIVNLYMPYDCHDNEDEFLHYMAKINDIIESYPTPYVYVMGDFNANLYTNNGNANVMSKFGTHMVNFCDEENMVIADSYILCNKSYTFVSSAHNTVSWLDHVVTTKPGCDLINNMCIKYDYVSSDHLPLMMQLGVSCVQVIEHEEFIYKPHIDWSSVDKLSRDTYSSNTAELLSNVQLDHDVINCQDVSCNNARHHKAIDSMYTSIVNALYDAGKFLLPKLGAHKYRPVPGWNEYAKAAHDEAREAFISWQVDNKPRMGPTYELMKVTRARFKQCLRHCKNIEDKARADALANKKMQQCCVKKCLGFFIL